LFLGLGVRETGQGTPQGQDGGVSGDIEWVGLSNKFVELLAGTNLTCDTTVMAGSDDVQLVPAGTMVAASHIACVSAGPDGEMQTASAGDDVLRTTPKGLLTVPTDGVYRQYAFNLPALQSSGNVFSFTGNGMLSAMPNNRGTLEHLVLTNDPTNAAVNANVMLLFFDDIVFEAPVLDPPVIVTQPNPPRPGDTSVMVTSVSPSANLVEVLTLGSNGGPDTVIGSTNPNGATTVSVPTSTLANGITLVARQRVGTDVSDYSVPVPVRLAGNGPLKICMAVRETDAQDHALGCGANGTGFDPNITNYTLEFIGATGTTGFGVPVGRRIVPSPGWHEVTYNPCTDGVVAFSGNGVLDLNAPPNYTNAVWEGLYFRIDDMEPTTGPFTVYIDDVKVKNYFGPGMDCLIDDFESYEVADYVVESGNTTADTVAAASDVQVRPVGSPTSAGQIIVAPGADGTLETLPTNGEIIRARHARFNYPSVAGTSVGLAPTPDRSAVTNETAFSGTKSLKLQWGYASAANLNSLLRLTSNELVASPPVPPLETFSNPDSVVRISNGLGCDSGNDVVYSFMMKFEFPPIPGDCDSNGRIDLIDIACLQRCFHQAPLTTACATFDIDHDGDADLADYAVFAQTITGP
jgi:hypothetical protein